ncbi:hypothetical protein TRIP_E130001 [uncultured Spirochaetota bacterium]|nr:hypothetical protein TRIP_E130001 [uncultured Spirochaetota bacterium]
MRPKEGISKDNVEYAYNNEKKILDDQQFFISKDHTVFSRLKSTIE